MLLPFFEAGVMGWGGMEGDEDGERRRESSDLAVERDSMRWITVGDMSFWLGRANGKRGRGGIGYLPSISGRRASVWVVVTSGSLPNRTTGRACEDMVANC